MENQLLSSKEILELTGLSRATLNNYIAQGLLPRPKVAEGGPGSRAPRIGYFPSSVLETIKEISSLKGKGFKMAQIAKQLKAGVGGESSGVPKVANSEVKFRSNDNVAEIGKKRPKSFTPPEHLRLTIDHLTHPAYMVNRKFEVEWCNEAAAESVLSCPAGLPSTIEERNLFRMFFQNAGRDKLGDTEELLRFHLAIGKNRLPAAALSTLGAWLSREDMTLLNSLYDTVDPFEGGKPIIETEVNLAKPDEAPKWYSIYASFFREGVFFTYVPTEADQNSLLALLARRDVVIRDLLRRRRPYLTPLAVLVADLQNSVKICAELPPEEYFELINQIWTTMEPELRRYYATYGKHVGDGMVYYFLPQPDSNYIFNAIQCAQRMREAMREISREWKKRKNWVNDLELNIGLDEGQEWFGTYQTQTHLEFTVLGDTVNQAARLSDFAKDGAVWATKKLIGTLSEKEKENLVYGVRRNGQSGQEILVRSTYSRISSIADLDDPLNVKFRDIGTLPVTELLDIRID